MPARRQLLQKITLNANAASVTFSNIPQTYTDLYLLISARNSDSNFTREIRMQINGDATAGRYTTRYMYGDSAAAYSGTETAVGNVYLGQTPAATSTANTFSNGSVYIPNYAGSSQKSVLSYLNMENNSTSNYLALTVGLYNQSTTVTSLVLSPNLGSFTAASTFYLYGVTQVPVIVGGTETISGGYKYHTFTSTSSLRVVEAGPVEYLVVAGGGGGGWSRAGGGGAGGLLSGRILLAPGSQTITIGGGGTAGTSGAIGGTGSASSIGSLLSTVGGGGGANSNNSTGASGGSGGGGAETGSGGAGTSGQGFSGGAGAANGGGGGGGGAGAAGTAGTTTNPGPGGAGLQVFGVYYAGGGGGGVDQVKGTAGASGGSGGGAAGSNSTAVPAAGQANTGGGGGGGGRTTSPSAEGAGSAGGSGVVIIRYPYISN